MSSEHGPLWRRWLVLFAVCAVAVPLSIRYADRPIADFVDANVTGSLAAHTIAQALGALRPLVLVAFLVFIVSGLKRLAGQNERSTPKAASVMAATVLISIGAEFILKQIFGRADIDPTYLRNHTFAFHFLNARDGWWAFPSGTSMGVFAIVGVLDANRSRYCSAAAGCAALISLATVVTNFHWLSDSIAGAFIGLTIGYATTGVLATEQVE